MTTKTIALVTRDSVTRMLENPNPAYVAQVVGRALVGLFERQTRHEQSSDSTQEYNMVGFTGADAYSGSLTAKYFMKHGHLLDWQVAKWTKKNVKGVPRLAKYHSQLNDIAVEKAAKSA